MNRLVLIIGAVLVLPLLMVLAKGFDFDPNVVESPLLGKPAPTFRLNDLEGNVYDLEQLLGRPVVVNFWSTYCPPCIVEHPMLMAASRRYAERVTFLGIIFHDDPQLIARFEGERGKWGPALVDPDGKVGIAFGVAGPPETFFISSDGVIVDKVIGQLQADSFVRTVESLL